MKLKKIKQIFLTLTLCFVTLVPVSAGFLTDDDYSEGNSESTEYASNTAINISVKPVPGEIDAVNITWDYTSGTTDQFIIGRTVSIPNNKKTALSAVSVKVINSSEKRVFVDRNIPEGKYYYVILSKSKIRSSNFDLYPNENYTVNPIVISKKPDSQYLPQVTDIKATVINGRKVVLTWNPLKLEGVDYNIYRSTEAPISSDMIDKAEKIDTVRDVDTYSDTSVEKTGKYYYAVTTNDSVRKEDKALTPDESYIVKPVLLNISASSSVTGLRAFSHEQGKVLIKWDAVSGFQGEYLIYRSSQKIDSAQKLGKAELIKRASSTESTYTDSISVPGAYYYAVLIKSTSGEIKKIFIENENFNNMPVEIGKVIRIRLVQASVKGGAVVIEWIYSGDTGSRSFKLFRISSKPESIESLENAYLVDDVDIESRSYTDKNVPDGKYYYVIVPQNYLDNTELQLVKGVNYNSDPVEYTSQKIITPYEIKTINAVVTGEIVKISWSFEGDGGETNYKLYRTEKDPSELKKENLSSLYLVDGVNLKDGIYTDSTVPEGKYYYIICPSNEESLSNFELVPNVTYTGKYIEIIYKKTEVKPEKENNEKPLNIEFDAGDVDSILKNYFYKGKYGEARVYLAALLKKTSSPQKRAYIKYYIGRTYAAQGYYNTALKYFYSSDVKKYYPEKAAFWQEFCLMRIKG